jgi:hypothetical protein
MAYYGIRRTPDGENVQRVPVLRAIDPSTHVGTPTISIIWYIVWGLDLVGPLRKAPGLHARPSGN